LNSFMTSGSSILVIVWWEYDILWRYRRE
jgi:hypothetical protein